MPYIKRKRIFKRKGRKYRKNRKFNKIKIRNFSGGNMRVQNIQSKGPLPNKFVTKFTYCATDLSIDPGAATPARYVFRLNSLFDPDYTSTGHQPMGFDQVGALYTYYTVIGAKATVQFQNTDTTTGQYVGAFVNQDAAVTIVPEAVMENGMGSYAILSSRTAGNDSTNTSLQVKWSAKKWFGTKNLVGDGIYTGAINGNPSQNAYLVCWAGGRSGTDTSAVYLDVIIEYIAVLTNPAYLSQS